MVITRYRCVGLQYSKKRIFTCFSKWWCRCIDRYLGVGHGSYVASQRPTLASKEARTNGWKTKKPSELNKSLLTSIHSRMTMNLGRTIRRRYLKIWLPNGDLKPQRHWPDDWELSPDMSHEIGREVDTRWYDPQNQRYAIVVMFSFNVRLVNGKDDGIPDAAHLCRMASLLQRWTKVDLTLYDRELGLPYMSVAWSNRKTVRAIYWYVTKTLSYLMRRCEEISSGERYRPFNHWGLTKIPRHKVAIASIRSWWWDCSSNLMVQFMPPSRCDEYRRTAVDESLLEGNQCSGVATMRESRSCQNISWSDRSSFQQLHFSTSGR